jgi:hypothetical protein
VPAAGGRVDPDRADDHGEPAPSGTGS